MAVEAIKGCVVKYSKYSQIVSWTVPTFQADYCFFAWDGDFLDYSKWSEEKWRWWLRSRKKYSLAALNKIYGTSYENWREVSQPAPKWGSIDLRPIWKDFQDYRRWTVCEWNTTMAETILSSDTKQRPLHFYVGGRPSAQAMQIYDDYFNVLKNLGSQGTVELTCVDDALAARWMKSLAVRYGLAAGGESSNERNAHKAIFNMIRYGYDVIVSRWFPPYGPPASPLSFKTARRYKPLFSALSGAVPVDGKAKIALLYSYQTALCSLGLPDEGMKIMDLEANKDIPFDIITDFTFMDAKGFERYDAIIACSTLILSTDVMRKLSRYVKGGGHLILYGNSGVFAKEDTDVDIPSYALIKNHLGYRGALDSYHPHVGSGDPPGVVKTATVVISDSKELNPKRALGLYA
jgi:hypothetical protein